MRLTAVLAIILAAATAHAQTFSDARAKKVIDDAISALGGKKFLAMEDRIESGRAYSFYNDKLTGLSIAKIYTRYLTPTPGKTGDELFVREKQALDKDEYNNIIFRKDGGWQVTFSGPQPLKADPIASKWDTTIH